MGEEKRILCSLFFKLIMMKKSSPTSYYFAVTDVCFMLKHQGYKY